MRSMGQPPASAPRQDVGLEPSKLHILVVSGIASARQEAVDLLRECGYQVTERRTSKEAMALFTSCEAAGAAMAMRQQQSDSETQQPDIAVHGPSSESGLLHFDIIFKEHGPPNVDAVGMLRRLAEEGLDSIPLVVMSTNDDYVETMRCLRNGAVDYLVKPLSRNQLQNVWKYAYFARRGTTQQARQQRITASIGQYGALPQSPTQTLGTQVTQCVDDQDPASKEGSAPDGTGSGRNGGSGGSKEGNNGSGTLDVKTGHGSNNRNSGDDRNGINSGSKNGNRGSNGNGCSTSRMAVAGSGNQPIAENHRHHHTHHHHTHHHHHPVIPGDAVGITNGTGDGSGGNGHGSNTNGNAHGSNTGNGHGSNNGGIGSGENGNGSGNNGNGQSTVQSQQTRGRQDGPEARECDVPSSRPSGQGQHASAKGGAGHVGFRQYTPGTTGLPVGPGQPAHMSGTKRTRPVEVGQLASAPVSRSLRHTRLPPSMEPTDAPQSNPYEASGTGDQGSTKPSLPTPQSCMGSAGNTAAGTYQSADAAHVAPAPHGSGGATLPREPTDAGSAAPAALGASAPVYGWGLGQKQKSRAASGAAHRLQLAMPHPEAPAKAASGSLDSRGTLLPPQAAAAAAAPEAPAGPGLAAPPVVAPAAGPGAQPRPPVGVASMQPPQGPYAYHMQFGLSPWAYPMPAVPPTYEAQQQQQQQLMQAFMASTPGTPSAYNIAMMQMQQQQHQMLAAMRPWPAPPSAPPWFPPPGSGVAGPPGGPQLAAGPAPAPGPSHHASTPGSALGRGSTVVHAPTPGPGLGHGAGAVHVPSPGIALGMGRASGPTPGAAMGLCTELPPSKQQQHAGGRSSRSGTGGPASRLEDTGGSSAATKVVPAKVVHGMGANFSGSNTAGRSGSVAGGGSSMGGALGSGTYPMGPMGPLSLGGASLGIGMSVSMGITPAAAMAAMNPAGPMGPAPPGAVGMGQPGMGLAPPGSALPGGVMAPGGMGPGLGMQRMQLDGSLSEMPSQEERRREACQKRLEAKARYERKKRNGGIHNKQSSQIRYASRKKLADQRPRIKGQFVKTHPGAESQYTNGTASQGEALTPASADRDGDTTTNGASALPPECVEQGLAPTSRDTRGAFGPGTHPDSGHHPAARPQQYARHRHHTHHAHSPNLGLHSPLSVGKHTGAGAPDEWRAAQGLQAMVQAAASALPRVMDVDPKAGGPGTACHMALDAGAAVGGRAGNGAAACGAPEFQAGAFGPELAAQALDAMHVDGALAVAAQPPARMGAGAGPCAEEEEEGEEAYGATSGQGGTGYPPRSAQGSGGILPRQLAAKLATSLTASYGADSRPGAAAGMAGLNDGRACVGAVAAAANNNLNNSNGRGDSDGGSNSPDRDQQD